MKTKALILTIGACASAMVGVAYAQNRTAPQARSGSAETSLVGISLYDTGRRVIARYGSPDEIQALSIGGSGVGPAGSGGARAPGGAGGGNRTSGGGSQAASALGTSPATPSLDGLIGDPFNQGSFNQDAPGEQDERGEPPSAPSAAGAAGGGAPGGGGGGAAAPSGGGSFVTYTRWVYNRKSSRYAFILDKFNRVVQIEALGLVDSRVRTRRGAAFGTSFGTLISKYNAPDGYEVNGETLIVRYLQRERVAFRLQRTKANKPQVVTGVVVAAGK